MVKNPKLKASKRETKLPDMYAIRNFNNRDSVRQLRSDISSFACFPKLPLGMSIFQLKNSAFLATILMENFLFLEANLHFHGFTTAEIKFPTKKRSILTVNS